jgi:hypothetical protein
MSCKARGGQSVESHWQRHRARHSRSPHDEKAQHYCDFGRIKPGTACPLTTESRERCGPVTEALAMLRLICLASVCWVAEAQAHVALAMAAVAASATASAAEQNKMEWLHGGLAALHILALPGMNHSAAFRLLADCTMYVGSAGLSSPLIRSAIELPSTSRGTNQIHADSQCSAACGHAPTAVAVAVAVPQPLAAPVVTTVTCALATCAGQGFPLKSAHCRQGPDNLRPSKSLSCKAYAPLAVPCA